MINIVKQTDCGLNKIRFEVTETSMIADFYIVLDFIKISRRLDIKISLNDFGSVLSSFSYLYQLALDYIKIDSVFIQ